MKPSRHAILLAVALAATALAYGPALRGAFQFDDWTSIQTNWRIRDPARIVAGFSPLDLLGPQRPVTDATFAVDYALGELDPLPYHLSSLAVHLAAAALAYLLARGALARAGHPRAGAVAVAAAAAFALHPLQSESVCYAAQRAEGLSSALYLAALLLLVRAYDAARWRAAGWAAGATVVAALALGAKTIAVTLPFAFLLWALVLGRRPGDATPIAGRVLRALARGAGVLALAAGSIAKNLVELGPGQTAGLHAGDLGPWRYLLTQLRVHWWYARLLVWPSGQSVDPAFPPSPSPPDAATWLAGLASAALLGAAAWLAWRSEREADAASPAARAAAFGVAWWYLLLAPSSSVVPIADVAAEHRPYLAVLGALLALAAAADALAASLRRPRALAGAAAAAVAACLALGVALSSRAEVWQSELSLWEDAARKHPESHRAVDNYAYALSAAGRREEAVPVFMKAQALARTSRQLANTTRNFAGLYLATGRPDAALGLMDLAVAAETHDWELRLGRADALRLLRRLDEAHEEARRAVSLAPGEPGARDVLGLVLLEQGEAASALVEFRRALEINPSVLYAEHVFLALARLDRRPEACAAWAPVRGSASPLARTTAAALGCPP